MLINILAVIGVIALGLLVGVGFTVVIIERALGPDRDEGPL